VIASPRYESRSCHNAGARGCLVGLRLHRSLPPTTRYNVGSIVSLITKFHSEGTPEGKRSEEWLRLRPYSLAGTPHPYMRYLLLDYLSWVLISSKANFREPLF
jgi:hypothetical protein